jgi:DNA polymerase/3'-5' exonuclease PolX
MILYDAQRIADKLIADLSPHCDRIEVAGSVRRQKPECGDIELVAIPKPYGVGIFESGIATVLDKYEVVKGRLPCKYTQRKIHSSPQTASTCCAKSGAMSV